MLGINHLCGFGSGSPLGQGTNPASFANVKLLLHGQGTVDTQVFTDNSASAHSFSVVGGAKLSTNLALSAYDGMDIFFETAGTRIYTAASADFRFPGDYAIEARLWPQAWGFVLMDMSTFGQIYIDATNVYWYYDQVGGYFSSPHAMSLSAWNTLCISRVGTTIKMWDNGAEHTMGSSSAVAGSNSNALYIGATAGGTYGFTGHLEEVRIVNGEGYSLYTPSIAAFPNS